MGMTGRDGTEGRHSVIGRLPDMVSGCSVIRDWIECVDCVRDRDTALLGGSDHGAVADKR